MVAAISFGSMQTVDSSSCGQVGGCVPAASAGSLLNAYDVPCGTYGAYGNCASYPPPYPVIPNPPPATCAAYDVYGNCVSYPVPPYPAVVPTPPPPGCIAFDVYGRCVAYQGGGGSPVNPYIPPVIIPTCVAFDVYGNCVAYQSGLYGGDTSAQDQGALWNATP